MSSADLHGRDVRDLPRAGTKLRPAVLTFAGRPLWVLSGQFVIVVAVVVEFGAYYPVVPKQLVGLILIGVTGAIAFGAHGRISRVLISAPVVAIFTWWCLSYFWTFNTFGWRSLSERTLPVLLSLVVVVGVLPIDDIIKGLLTACQVAIGYTLFFTLTNPGVAMSHPDGNAGWTGGFIHKNALAPFMLFAILVAASFDNNQNRRRATYAIAAFYILMSQSTTILIVGIILVPLAILIRWTSNLSSPSRSTILLTSFVAAGFAGIGAVLGAGQILGARGKDLTLSSRTIIWDSVLDAIAKRPIEGYGVGGVWINPGAEPTLTIMRPLGFTVFHAHNGYLEVLLQLGAVGLGLVLVLMFTLLRHGVILLRSDVDLATFLMMFVALIALTSLSEVTMLGIWLVLLCTFQTVAIRVRRGDVRRTGVR